MPAATPVIALGNVPTVGTATLTNEVNFTVTGVSIGASREEKEYRDDENNVDGWEGFNPIAEGSIEGVPLADLATDLSSPGVGQVVGSVGFPLANFSAETFCHDPAVGTIILINPSRQMSSEGVTQTMPWKHFPFIA